jgi:hypothetical protein
MSTKEEEKLEDVYVTSKKNVTDQKKEKSLRQISNYITTKLYPVPYVNGKGYRIGNFNVLIDKRKLPFSSFDQVDHFLYNLFDYVKTPKNKKKSNKPNDNSNDYLPTDEFNKQFFKNYKEKILTVTPVNYQKKVDETDYSKTGGYKTTIRHRLTKKKSVKNRTRKNRKS